jgi:hypothetical protein
VTAPKAIIIFVGLVGWLSLPTVRGRSQPSGETQEDTLALPKNLIAELRIFESRNANPDRDKLSELDFLIKTDGRGVTANQWLATMVKQVPNASVAALAYDISRVNEDGRSTFRWINGRRSLDVEIRIVARTPPNRFQAEVRSVLRRDEEALSETQREANLQLNRTTIWSTEVEPTDYMSLFRQHQDLETRGLLYEELRSRSVHLLVAISLRVLRDDEIPQLTPFPLSLPPGVEIPEIENPFDFSVTGDIVVGFELSAEGAPVNPEITWSTLPEINPFILGETKNWRFPSSAPDTRQRKWGRVDLNLVIPKR